MKNKTLKREKYEKRLFWIRRKIELQESNLFLDGKVIEKMEDFFKELNLLDEYLNNSYLKEKNHFMGLDMLKIQVEKNLKKLKDLLLINSLTPACGKLT